MKRNNFIKSILLGAGATIAGSSLLKASDLKLDKEELDIKKQVGHNHLPNKEIKKMKSIIHKAETRGYANHGWLKSNHTFSFANYYNPERIHFGALRVLNDDQVAGGMGFGTHPHDNMEIISIPLEGDLAHKDSMGNGTTIKSGDIQVMSAGTGITHSEFNPNENNQCKFLQIWLFPNKRNVQPRYDQITLDESKMKNKLLQVVSPNENDEGTWIHQNTWFHVGKFEAGKEFSYELNDKTNGVYVFLIEGEVNINGEELTKRDGIGIWETEKISFKNNTNSHLLIMEVPMLS